MQIILMYKPGGNGQVAFAADEPRGVPERRYHIVDGVLTLTGYAEDILHKDAAELLGGDAYRLLTPQEQEAMAQDAQQANQIQEDVSTQGETVEVSAKQKKANGGGD